MVDKNKNKKYNYAIIVGAVTFVGLIIVVFAIIRPLYLKSQALTAEVKAKQATLDQLKDKKQKLAALKDREAELKQDAETVQAALPDSAEVGRLFIQINEMVKATGGNVSSVSGSPVPQGDTGVISKVNYTVPVSFPNYFNFKDFVIKSEQALRLFDITDFSISTANGSVSSSLSANTYVRK
jgi:Tfp pilus assembly protein PilO